MAEPPKNGVQKVVFLTKFDFNYYVLEASGALYCIQIFSRIILSKVFDNNYIPSFQSLQNRLSML